MVCVNVAKHAARDLGKMYHSQPEENVPISEYRVTFYRGNEVSVLGDLIAKHRDRILSQDGIDIGGMTDLGFWGKILVRNAKHRIVDLFDEFDLALFDVRGVPIYLSHCYQAGGKIPRPSESDWTVYTKPSIHSCPIGRVIVSDATTEPGVWWIYGLLDFSGISPNEDAKLREQLLNKRLGGLSLSLEYTKIPGETLPALESDEIRGSPVYTLHCGRQVRFREISLVELNDCPEARIITIKAANPESLGAFNTLIQDVTSSPTDLKMDTGSSATAGAATAAAPTSSPGAPPATSSAQSAMDVDSHADKKSERASATSTTGGSSSSSSSSSQQATNNSELSKQVEAILKAREASMSKPSKSAMDVDPKPTAPEPKRTDPEESVRDKALREMAEKLAKAEKRMEMFESEAAKRAELEAKNRADDDDVKKRAKELSKYAFPKQETRKLLSKVDAKERDALQEMLIKQAGSTSASSKSASSSAPSGPLGTMWEPARQKSGNGSGAAPEPMTKDDRPFQKSGDAISFHPSITPDKITPELAALQKLVNRNPGMLFEANGLAPLFMKQ